MSGERRCTVPGCDGQTEREPDRAGRVTGRPIQVWRCSKCGDVVHYQLQVGRPAREVSRAWRCVLCGALVELAEPAGLQAVCCPGCGMTRLRPWPPKPTPGAK